MAAMAGFTRRPREDRLLAYDWYHHDASGRCLLFLGLGCRNCTVKTATSQRLDLLLENYFDRLTGYMVGPSNHINVFTSELQVDTYTYPDSHLVTRQTPWHHVQNTPGLLMENISSIPEPEELLFSL